MLKVVIDTNIFISGLLGSETNRKLIQLIREKEIILVISPELFEELIRTSRRTKFHKVISPQEVKTLAELINSRALFVRPVKEIDICRHPPDNKILECAVEGKVKFIITNDDDLLSLKSYQTITILTSWKYLAINKV